jgi:hypothetical protein
MSTWLSGSLIVLGSVLLSLLALFAVRRRLRTELLKEHHDVAAAIYAVVGTIYAVLLAFAVVIVWQAFTDTQGTVAQEANALSDLERMSRGFPVQTRRQVHEAARTYGHVVITREWPLMAQGHSSPQANAALVELWHVYTDLRQSERSNPLYAESLTRLNDLTDHRRLRLLASQNRVPLLMWLMLALGGVMVVLFSYLFAVGNLWHQAFMTVMLSGMIAFGVFLIFALNGPFAGSVKVKPSAFVTALQNMEHVER